MTYALTLLTLGGGGHGSFTLWGQIFYGFGNMVVVDPMIFAGIEASNGGRGAVVSGLSSSGSRPSISDTNLRVAHHPIS